MGTKDYNSPILCHKKKKGTRYRFPDSFCLVS